MTTISNVTGGTPVSAVWGNAVADGLNDVLHLAMLRGERITGGQSIPASTPTVLIYNAVIGEADEAGDLSLATGTGIVTVARAGWYLVIAGVRWDLASSASYCRISLFKNTTEFAGTVTPLAPAINVRQTVSGPIQMAAGDTLKAEVEQTSTAAINAQASKQTFLTVARLREA